MKKIYVAIGMVVVVSGLAVRAAWTAEEVRTAAKLYAAKCASCHAKDAKGNPAMAKAFKMEPEKLNLLAEASLKKTDAELAKITTDGSGKMPAYKGKLSDADIKGLVGYIRSLAPKK